jgi:hypothetical protein
MTFQSRNDLILFGEIGKSTCTIPLGNAFGLNKFAAALASADIEV